MSGPPVTVRITQTPITVEFEAGSLGEAVSILQDSAASLNAVGKIAISMTSDVDSQQSGTQPAPAKRGRKPAEAAAPAPIAPPTPPVSGVEIPEFLKRDANNQVPATSAPPPPPLPNAPPIAPPTATPPVGQLAGKVIDDLEKRKAASADAGKGLADWLAQNGVVVSGATYDESIAVLRLTSDDKLVAIAGALGIQ